METTIQFPINANNELSYLQQIQGGQQIDEESSAIPCFENPMRTYRKSTYQSPINVCQGI